LRKRLPRPLCDALPAALIIPALRPPAQRPAYQPRRQHIY